MPEMLRTFSWPDGQPIPLELIPRISVKYDDPSSAKRVISDSWCDLDLSLQVANLLENISAQASFRIGNKEIGKSFSVNLERAGDGTAKLVTAGRKSFALDLDALEVFGRGDLILKVDSYRLIGGVSLLKLGKLERPFKISIGWDDKNLELDLVDAIAKAHLIDALQVGQPLKIALKESPKMSGGIFEVGISYGSAAVEWKNLSSPVEVVYGIHGDWIQKGASSAAGVMIRFRWSGEVTGTKKRPPLKTFAAIQLVKEVKKPKIREFSASEKEWNVGGEFSYVQFNLEVENLHPSYVGKMNLLAVSAEGQGFAKFNVFVLEPLAGKADVYFKTILVKGGRASDFYLCRMGKCLNGKDLNRNSSWALALCRVGQVFATKEKTFAVNDVFFEEMSLGRNLAMEIKADWSLEKGEKANAVLSNLLNVPPPKSQSSVLYPVDLENVLKTQMKVDPQVPKAKGGFHDATKDEVRLQLDPSGKYHDESNKFQFLRLDAVVTVSDQIIDKWLETYWERAGRPKIYDPSPKVHLKRKNLKNPHAHLAEARWTLSGMGAVFNRAARESKLNVVYLVSHCLVETGGVNMIRIPDGDISKEGDQTRFFNAYGYAAADGRESAGSNAASARGGWTDPAKAIIGGAKAIARDFIYEHDRLLRNTLYKMRWNPEWIGSGRKGITGLYSSDATWAESIASKMRKFSVDVNSAEFCFEYPYYKGQKDPLA